MSSAAAEGSDARSDQESPTPDVIAIDEFEGEYVRLMRGKIPSIVLEMDGGFRRGTHLKVQMELRVRQVGYVEATAKEQRGELVREHQFAIEEVALLGELSDSEADPGVGGSASGRVAEIDALGVMARECFYDVTEATVVHRGGCDRCSHRMRSTPSDPSDAGF